MPVPENISSKNETDDQRERVITPDRLHYSDSDSDVDNGMIPEQSEMIFKQFLAQRFAEENLSNVQAFPQSQQQNYFNYQLQMPPRSGQGSGYSLSDELTRDMSHLAETFRRSGGRQEVTEQVASIDLGTLSQENLSLMLSQLFEDGVTPARLLVLFYLCSDLAVRAARSGLLHLLTSVTSWSLAFVKGAVSTWVRLRGGWTRVIQALSSASGLDSASGPDSNNISTSQTVNKVALASACAAVVGVCAIYMKKNL